MSEIAVNTSARNRSLAPIAGLRGFGVLSVSHAEYLVLVDFNGRQIRPGKRDAITGPPPAVLRRLGYGSEQWTRQVMALRLSFSRAVGQVASLVEKAAEIGQFWLRGVSVARALAENVAGAS